MSNDKKVIRHKKRTPPPKPTNPESGDHVEMVMIPVEDLIPNEDNPNEMKPETFDLLIEEIRDQGFDEPILVRPHPKIKGKFEIGSGHHRTKAAMVIGMQEVPAIVKDWNDREIKVALVKRNVMHGEMNKAKLAQLFKDVSKGRDAKVTQRELGFTDQKKFEALIDQAEKSMTPKQKKKLAAAKESIKSMDDLSSVLNTIFRESGSELDHGYMVFSWGGRNHHYFQIDEATDKKLKNIITACDDAGITYTDFIQSIVADAELPTGGSAGKKKPKVVRKRKK